MPPKMNKFYKCCAVPHCGNTTSKTPNKLFIYVPCRAETRAKWFKLARRDPESFSPNSHVYFCEDHFDLPNDMENYMVHHVLGFVSKIQLKPGCVPSKFACLPQRKSTGSCPENPYIVKKSRSHIDEECLNSHAQLHDTLKGKPTETDTRMYENIDVKCEKDDVEFQVAIKEEVPNDINKQAKKGTEGHKEVLGCISKVDTLVNEKFAIAVKAQNYTFQLESIPLRNFHSEILKSEELNYLNSEGRTCDGSFNEEGKRKIKKEEKDESGENNEVLDYISKIEIHEHEIPSTMNSGDDNFESDIKPIMGDLSNSLTGQEINNCRDELTNVNNEEDNNTPLLHIKPVIIRDVYDTGQELMSGDKLNNSIIRESEKEFKTRIVTENPLDYVSGIDTKPVIIHDVYSVSQELNDLTTGDVLSNPNIKEPGNARESYTNKRKRASINDNNTNNSFIETEEFHISINKEKFEPLNKRAKNNHQDVSKSKVNKPDILPEEGLVLDESKNGDDNLIENNHFNRNGADKNDYLEIMNHAKTKQSKTKFSSLKKNKGNSDKKNQVNCDIGKIKASLIDDKLKSKAKKYQYHESVNNADTECANVVNNIATAKENSTEYKYSCLTCDFKTNSKKFMQSHTNLHFDIKNMYVCDHCGYITKVKSCLIKHIERHIGKLRHSCKMCSYKCKYSYSLKSHMKTHSEKTLSCDICEYKCRHVKLLNNHIKTHTEKRVFECNFCQYKCTIKSYLVKHIRTHTGEKPFSCKICKAKFAWSGDLAKHVRIHSKVKPHSCTVCMYKTVDKQTLTKHMRIHTGVKPYKCEYCPYASTIACSLRQHLNIHTGERPYMCKLCNYASKQQSALVSHMRTHTKEKPYHCNVCDYKAVQKTHLDRHIMRHTGEKPFICDICMYKCSRKCVLMDHMKTHASDRPHSCKFCNYTCKRKASLILHERTHTGEKPFACRLCNYECARSSSLNSHMMRRH